MSGAHMQQRAHRRFAKIFGGGNKARFEPTAIFSEQETIDPTSAAATDSVPDVTIITPTISSTTPTVTPTLPATSEAVSSDVALTTTTPETDLTTTTSSITTTSSPLTTTDALPSTTTPLTTPTTSATVSHSTTILTLSQTTTSGGIAVASASVSSTPVSATKTGTIVGAVGGGILGLAVLIAVIAFILRRCRKREDEEPTDFDPHTFRRSAMLMDEPPTHEDTVVAGYNRRPSPGPNMSENRVSGYGATYDMAGPNMAGQFGQHAQYAQNGAYPNYANYNENGMDSQNRSFMEMNASPPMTANSANPLFIPSAYGQTPYSPMASPISTNVAPYDSAYDNHSPAAAPQVFTRTPSQSSQAILSRQPSTNQMPLASPTHDEAQYVPYPTLSPGSARHSVPMPTSDYVDLSRSSVTPFQAAQYVEISKKLNTSVPEGLATPAVNEFVKGHQNRDSFAPPVPSKSPFSDPSIRDSAAATTAAERSSYISMTSGSHDTSHIAQDLDFPVPPTPAMITDSNSRYRVTSTPPTLPEIRVQSRSSDYDFPSSIHGSPAPTPLASGFPSGVSGLAVGQGVSANDSFPATPSPLSSSFVISPPPTAQSGFAEAAADRRYSGDTVVAVPPPAARARPDAAVKRPDTVYTIYDPEDAYGGI